SNPPRLPASPHQELLSAPLRLASLHQQQRNEIMHVVSVSVNKFLKHFTRQPRLGSFPSSLPNRHSRFLRVQ
ncbi:hypothetical protein QCE42_11455, partial [Caballeronia sp. LZ050]|uniref:hypothetical protein n=1 Tax=Caballeronia sp. LZ050 TaxID=3038570 RepID=UPI00285F84BD